MKFPASIFAFQETMLLREFAKTNPKGHRTQDEWLDDYLTFRREYEKTLAEKRTAGPSHASTDNAAAHGGDDSAGNEDGASCDNLG